MSNIVYITNDVQKVPVIKEQQEAIYKYGVSSLINFEAKFICQSTKNDIVIPFNYDLTNPKLKQVNSYYLSESDKYYYNWLAVTYTDCYYTRFESFEVFWRDWNIYKKMLKLSAFL